MAKHVRTCTLATQAPKPTFPHVSKLHGACRKVHVHIDARKYVVDARKGMVDTRKYVVDARKYVVDARKYVVDARKYVVDAPLGLK